MKKFIILLVCLMALPGFVSYNMMDAKSKKKKSKGKTELVEKKDSTSKKKTSKYDKTFVKDKNCVTARAEGANHQTKEQNI